MQQRQHWHSKLTLTIDPTWNNARQWLGMTEVILIEIHASCGYHGNKIAQVHFLLSWFRRGGKIRSQPEKMTELYRQLSLSLSLSLSFSQSSLSHSVSRLKCIACNKWLLLPCCLLLSVGYGLLHITPRHNIKIKKTPCLQSKVARNRKSCLVARKQKPWISNPKDCWNSKVSKGGRKKYGPKTWRNFVIVEFRDLAL